MIRIVPTEMEMIEAKARAESMGILSSSVLKGAGNLVGFVGEQITARHTGGRIIDSYDYDIKIDDLRIDVKTKSCSTRPKGSYLCSVMSYQLNNECDGYIFCRVNLTSKEAWILGYISKLRLLDEGFTMSKGDMDGKFKVVENCISISIFDLDEVPVKRKVPF